MGKPVRNLRMFVAAYPPVDVSRAAIEAVRALELPGHRLTAVDQVHLTLQFIGDVAVRELEDVSESVRRAAAGIGAVMLTPGGLIALPEHGPARLIALETDAPGGVVELHERLVARLAREPRKGDEKKRGFRPHMTLARFRSPVGRPWKKGRESHSLDAMLPERIAGAGAFVVDRIALMRSALLPEGAVHQVVEWVSL